MRDRFYKGTLARFGFVLSLTVLGLLTVVVGLGAILPQDIERPSQTVALSGSFSGGSGTQTDPYIVTNARDFLNIRYFLEGHFLQTSNIDFGGQEIEPLGSSVTPFEGSYDGQQYILNNLNITKPTQNAVGVFAFSTGVLKGINLTAATVKGVDSVGGIVGVNLGVVLDSINGASVQAMGDNVGGIAGLNQGTISTSLNRGDITTQSQNAGGIAGTNFGSIDNSYNLGTIYGGTYVGGIAGSNNNTRGLASIVNTYNYAMLYGSARGQIAGENTKGSQKYGYIADAVWINSNPNITASFGATEVVADIVDDTNIILSSNNIVFDAFPLDASQFVKRQAFDWVDFDRYWQFLKNAKFPTLRSQYVKVESIEFANGEQLGVQPGQDYSLKTIIKPSNATIQDSKMEIVGGFEFALLDAIDNSIHVLDDTPIGTTIQVVATAESYTAVTTILVVKVPVTSIQDIIVAEGTTNIVYGNVLNLSSRVLPNNATESGIVYETDVPYAFVSQLGQLSVAEDFPIGQQFFVTARSVDNPDIYTQLAFFTDSQPVLAVEIVGADSFKVTERLALQALITPQNATNKIVEFKILDATAQGANLRDNILTAQGLGTITIVASSDGVYSKPLVVQVTKEPVQSITFDNDSSFKVTQSLQLQTTVYPINATFLQVEYSIVGNNTVGATIGQDNVLRADREGLVVVRATADGATQELAISVRREPVESIQLKASYVQGVLRTMQFVATVYPSNATVKKVQFVVTRGKASIDPDSGLLKIDMAAPASSQIDVIAIAQDNGIASPTYTVYAERIEVEQVYLVASATREKADDKINLTVSTKPTIVSNSAVSYQVVGDGKVTNGKLVINTDATPDSTITVVAIVDGVRSNEIEVTVEKTAVENIIFQNEDNFAITDGLQLLTRVLPYNASYPKVKFEILGENLVDAHLSASGFLTASKLGNVTIRASADGVYSIMVIQAGRQPATSITLDSTQFRTSQQLVLTGQVYPNNATYKDLSFEIIQDGGTLATLVGNVLTARYDGTIVLRSTVVKDGYHQDFDITVKEELVTNIELTSASSFVHTDSLVLGAKVYPSSATYGDIKFSIQSGAVNTAGAKLVGSVLTATRPGTVKITASTNNFSKTFDITVNKQAITSIEFDNPNVYTLREFGGGVTLSTKVMPLNATYPNVKYEIVEQDGGFELIDDNSLTNKQAKLGKVTIRAFEVDSDTISSNNFEAYHTIELVGNALDRIELRLGTALQNKRLRQVDGYFDILAQSSNANAIVVVPYPADATTNFGDIKLYYQVYNDKGVIVVSKTDAAQTNVYFEYKGTQVKIKATAPVGYTVQFVVDLYGKQASVDFGIDFVYESDIKNSTIASDGLFELKNLGENLENLMQLGVPLSLRRYEIAIVNGSAISFDKTITTSTTDTKLWILLYKQSLGTDYQVKLNIVLYQNGVEFGYQIAQSFSINKTPQSQIDDYNSKNTNKVLVAFDLYNPSAISYSKTITADARLQAMYVYGNQGPQNTNLNFVFDNKSSQVDLYIKNFHFGADDNKNAISVNGSGTLNLTTIGTVYIRGGNGWRGANDGGQGGKGILASSLSIDVTGNVYIYGGNGGKGFVGGNNYQRNGGNGGNAIDVNTITASSGSIYAYGGRGGYGVDNDSGNGNRGGDGGHGGHAIKVVQSLSIQSSLQAQGGNGGNGGDGHEDKSLGATGGHGGHAGNGGHAIAKSSSASTSVVSTAILRGGTKGTPGKGGAGGWSGNNVGDTGKEGSDGLPQGTI